MKKAIRRICEAISNVLVKYALNKSNLTLNVGEGYMLQLYAVKNVKWTSSDEHVATVDSRGVVCGRHGGNAIITAHYGIFDLNALDCAVTVNDNRRSQKTNSKKTAKSASKKTVSTKSVSSN